jgi:hypothetical protein
MRKKLSHIRIETLTSAVRSPDRRTGGRRSHLCAVDEAGAMQDLECVDLSPTTFLLLLSK